MLWNILDILVNEDRWRLLLESAHVLANIEKHTCRKKPILIFKYLLYA